MNRLLYLSCVGGLLAGCTPPDESACLAGVREDFQADVLTTDGFFDIETSQCISSKWTHAACEQGSPELCRYMFEPNTPAKVPVELIFDDFVFTHAVGSLALTPPAAIAGTADIQTGLWTVAEDRVANGFRSSPVQPFTMFDGSPAYELTVSCDHPSVDAVCPFTWRYVIVDLSDRGGDLYADFSIQYANFVDAGNVAAPLPEEFDDYQLMIDSIELIVDGA